MWVKLTLPPRARRRWLLITTRLSASSFAGTARTLVDVGTVSEVGMLATTRAAAPRRTVEAGGAGLASWAGPSWTGRLTGLPPAPAGFGCAGFGGAVGSVSADVGTSGLVTTFGARPALSGLPPRAAPSLAAVSVVLAVVWPFPGPG